MRTCYAYTILLALLSFTCSRAKHSAVNQNKKIKHVVLILTDDQGAHLSALGTSGIRTPHIDQLAKNGTLFTQALAVVPSCSPSRSSIMTGMHPHSNGHWRNTITPKLSDPDSMFSRSSNRVDRVGIHEYIATLPEMLGANGFYTAITQKFHMSPPWKFPYSSRDPVHNDPAGFKAAMERFITEAGDRPFFIQANISPPHRPFHHHMEQFPDFLPDTAAIAVFPFLPDVPEVRLDLQQYFGSVQLADACAGALIEVLREQNLLEQTLVIFTGDQGAPFHRAKASAYYAGLHVPFVISGPDIKKDHTSAAMISLIDIMPTILDYLDMPIPETVQGASILPIARGEKEGITGRKYLFGEHNSHGPNRKEHYPTRIVFDGRFYYMQNLMPEKDYLLPDDLAKKKGWGNLSYEATLSAAEQYPLPYALLKELESGRPPVELYDLQEDPAQLNNLAGSPKYIRQEEELRLVLKEWRKTTGDFANDPLQIPTRLKEAVNN